MMNTLNSTPENVIIVGSGPAGLTAAIYCARAGLDPLVIEGMAPGGQLVTTTEVENFPGFPDPIQGPDLVLKMRAQAERFGTRFLGGEVTGADFAADAHALRLDGDRTVRSRTLILACGAEARYLGLPSEQKLLGRGVSACATCDGAFFRGQAVAVIGGGDTAMEEALFLARLASRVTVVHRRDAFRASTIMAERVLKHPKIDVRWNALAVEVLDVEQETVTGLILRDVHSGDRDRLEVSGVFVAIGHKPNTEIFKGMLAMDDAGYLLTRNTCTEVSGVFAAGDIQDHTYRQAVTAAGSGCMAALEAERYLGAR